MLFVWRVNVLIIVLCEVALRHVVSVRRICLPCVLDGCRPCTFQTPYSQTAGATSRTPSSHPISKLATTHATHAPVEQIANKVKIPKRPLGYMGGGIPTQGEEKIMMCDHETCYVSRYPKDKIQIA